MQRFDAEGAPVLTARRLPAEGIETLKADVANAVAARRDAQTAQRALELSGQSRAFQSRRKRHNAQP